MKRAAIFLVLAVVFVKCREPRTEPTTTAAPATRSARIVLPRPAFVALAAETRDVRAAVLRGKVVRDDGVACPRPKIEIAIAIVGLVRHTQEIQGDDAGRFVVGRLPPGDVHVRAWGAGCVTDVPIELDLALGEHREITITATRGYSVRGTVVVSGTRTPVVGARILAGGDETFSSLDGTFALHGFGGYDGDDDLAEMVPEEVRLTVAHAAFATTVVLAEVFSADVDLHVELSPGRTVRGRVTPPGITEITGNVYIARHPVRLSRQRLKTTTAADGTFELHHVPDVELTLVASRDGMEGAAALEKEAGEILIELEPEPLVTETLRILDETDAPIAGARVTVTTTQSRATFEGTTDETGRVTFTDVPPSVAEIAVAGHPPLAEGDDTIGLGSGDRAERVIVVRASPEGRTVRGRVVDERGLPAPNIWVHADPAHDAVTAADGTFALAGLLEKPLSITAASPSRDRVASLEIVPGDDEVELVLEARFSVELRVMSNGRRVTHFDYGCRDPDGDWVHAGDGRPTLHAGRLRSLPRGPLTCQARTAGGAGMATIAVGTQDTLVIELAPTATIRGRVREPLDIMVRSPGGHAVWDVPGEDGRFEIRGLAAGATTVEIGERVIELTTKSGEIRDLGDIR